MIIDSHQHFWNYDPIRDIWIDNSMAVLKRNFLPKDLKKYIKLIQLRVVLQYRLTNQKKKLFFY